MTVKGITARAQFDAPIENTEDMAKMVTLMRPARASYDTPGLAEGTEDAVRHDNNRRASFAAEAVLSYAQRCFGYAVGEDWETIIGDMMCDLMHLSDALGVDFDYLVEKGRRHYEPETHGVL